MMYFSITLVVPLKGVIRRLILCRRVGDSSHLFRVVATTHILNIIPFFKSAWHAQSTIEVDVKMIL